MQELTFTEISGAQGTVQDRIRRLRGALYQQYRGQVSLPFNVENFREGDVYPLDVVQDGPRDSDLNQILREYGFVLTT